MVAVVHIDDVLNQIQNEVFNKKTSNITAAAEYLMAMKEGGLASDKCIKQCWKKVQKTKNCTIMAMLYIAFGIAMFSYSGFKLNYFDPIINAIHEAKLKKKIKGE